MLIHLPDLAVPTFSGEDARRALTRRWGLPNAYPRANESLFHRSRVLFVDDDNDGRPVAFWIPTRFPVGRKR